MTDEPNRSVTAPGKCYSFRAGTVPAAGPQVNLTVGTASFDFEKVKHLLSDKPLRGSSRIVLPREE